jgi:hypothetical protein
VFLSRQEKTILDDVSISTSISIVALHIVQNSHDCKEDETINYDNFYAPCK